MKKYVFYDCQTGGYSAHTTIEGLAEMLIQDWLRIIKSDGNEEELINETKKWSNPTKNEMIELIESHGYEILEPTEDNIREYENYHGINFE